MFRKELNTGNINDIIQFDDRWSFEFEVEVISDPKIETIIEWSSPFSFLFSYKLLITPFEIVYDQVNEENERRRIEKKTAHTPH